ncbi:major facilitator superfamily domain-containing protein [Hyaloraphidium curvatum]|nr:major facilitator superfamily domain-containing protein [Hyaloraphidium curvatum]
MSSEAPAATASPANAEAEMATTAAAPPAPSESDGGESATPPSSPTLEIIDDDGIPSPTGASAELAKEAAEIHGAAAPPPQDEGSAATMSTANKILGMMSLSLAMTLYALDATMVSTALPTIANQLHGEDLLTWVGTAYLLTSTAIAPLWGKLGDIFGRRNLLLLNILLFILASVLCALAPTMVILIVGRGLQGVGGGGVQSLVFVLISDVVTMRERGTYQALMSVITGVCFILGPFLGGVVTDYWSWTGIFWINLPAGALAMAGIVLFLRVPPPPDKSIRAMLRRVDYGGAALCIVGVTLFLLGLTWSIEAGWASAKCLAPLLIGVALMVGFVLYEWKVPAEPNVPLRLFRNRNFSICVFVMFTMGWSMNGAAFYIPQVFQLVYGQSASQSGLSALPWIAPFMPVSMACGIVSSRKGIYTPFPKVGLAVATVALGLLSMLSLTTPYAEIAGFLAMMGVGFGASLGIVMLAVQANCELRDIGPGTTVGTFLRTIGGTMGIGVGGTILQNTVQSLITPSSVTALAAQFGVTPQAMGTVVTNSLAGTATSPSANVTQAAIDGGQAAVRAAYAQGFSRVFIGFVPLCAVGWLVVLFLKHVPLKGHRPGDKKKAAEEKGEKGLEAKDVVVDMEMA